LAALNRHGVRYVLISGQACVHYGATQFTKDIDLWVESSEANLHYLVAALGELSARQRFLPPLERAFLERGHAVHFEVDTEAAAYRVDLMTHPPRVGAFDAAERDATESSVAGVRCPVVDLARLVELKKTQRDEDYPVIARLVSAIFRYLDGHPDERQRLGLWVCHESRSPEELLTIATEWPGGAAMLADTGRAAAVAAVEAASRRPFDWELAAGEVGQALRREQDALQREDREYWRPRLAELRALHRADRR